MQPPKKNEAEGVIKANVVKICIDDFAIKRRHKYGTIMVDIESRLVIDIVESREAADVAKWLSAYPNIQVVSRDGSSQYAAAIRQAHPDAIQVSDRFHLFKNLTDSAKEHITKLVGSKFCIAKEGGGDYGGEYWKRSGKHELSLPERKHIATTKKKEAVMEKARELAALGYKARKIAEAVGISYPTAKKYIDESFTPGFKGYGSKRPCMLSPYIERINAMLEQGRTFREIEAELRKSGYKGSRSAISMYAARQRRLVKLAKGSARAGTELIERKWVTKLLYKPIEKVEEITADQLARVIKEYPGIGAVYDVVRYFKEVVFSKNVQGLDAWMEAAESLGIKEIDSFINGIKRDLEAVKNAIRYDYSNGLAEGKINKLKLAKRIMYGRNSFRLLRNKLLMRESLSIN